MILQALKAYYDRKSADPESKMAPPGFEWKEISFLIILETDGTPVNIEPTHEGEGKKRRAKLFLVPQGIKKTRGVAANLLWDNAEYALGIEVKSDASRVVEQHEAFKAKILEMGKCPDEGLAAINAFLSKKDKVGLLKTFGNSWAEILLGGSNITFKLTGDKNIVAERPEVKKAILEGHTVQGSEDRSICLVSGQDEITERLHSPIKGVYRAQTSGANIVSFNLDAFRSFGKTQGANTLTSPPQPDRDRVWELARLQIGGFFYAITYDYATQRGGFWPGDFFPLAFSLRSDWGNPVQLAFMRITSGWPPRIIGGTAQGFFSVAVRRHPGSKLWSWAIEWNENLRAIGLFGEREPAISIGAQFPTLEGREFGTGARGAWRVRAEVPLRQEDDTMFLAPQEWHNG